MHARGTSSPSEAGEQPVCHGLVDVDPSEHDDARTITHAWVEARGYTAPMVSGHDIVVIGASAGGVDALSNVASGLPSDLPAAVFIVLHMPAEFHSRLPEILMRRGPLRAAHAVHGEAIVPGRIYVAPPDNHLMLHPGYLNVVRGPKENGHRPAVDALFRTASKAYGPRVIGVVLTGYLDCGTAGLLSVKARGGIAVVQDPADAAVPDMPNSAISHVAVDHVAPLREISELVARLAREPTGPSPEHLPRALAQIDGDEPGVAADIVCPHCQGKLTETELNGFEVFRCHVGHAFSSESVSAEQADAVERALWAAARALEESATLAQRCAERSTGVLQRTHMEKAQVHADQAQIVRRLILEIGGKSRSSRPPS